MCIPAVCLWGVASVIFWRPLRAHIVAIRVIFLLVGVALYFAGVQFLRGGQVVGGVVSLLGGSGVLVTVLSSSRREPLVIRGSPRPPCTTGSACGPVTD